MQANKSEYWWMGAKRNTNKNSTTGKSQEKFQNDFNILIRKKQIAVMDSSIIIICFGLKHLFSRMFFATILFAVFGYRVFFFFRYRCTDFILYILNIYIRMDFGWPKMYSKSKEKEREWVYRYTAKDLYMNAFFHTKNTNKWQMPIIPFLETTGVGISTIVIANFWIKNSPHKKIYGVHFLFLSLTLFYTSFFFVSTIALMKWSWNIRSKTNIYHRI